MRIAELPKAQYAGFPLIFRYDSVAYYDLRLRCGESGFSAEFVRTPCPPLHKEFTDLLYAAHWENPRAYGVLDGDALLAVLEVAQESWNHRLRVTNLWVKEGFRRRGLGSLLITKAREIARADGCRAIILETQSCNSGAIAFYLNQGLTFMGFNACEYSNQDAARHEVRVEMGCLLT